MSKEKTAMVVIFAILTFVASFYIYKIIDLNEKIKITNTNIKKEQEYITSLNNQLHSFNNVDISEKMKKSYEGFPDTKQISTLISFIDNTAIKNNVDVLSVEMADENQPQQNKKQEVNTKSSLEKVTVNLEISARYAQLRGFLIDLYQSKRVLNIITGEMKFAENQWNETHFTLTIIAYYNPNLPTITHQFETLQSTNDE